MDLSETKLSKRRAVGQQAIGRDLFRLNGLVAQQAPQQCQRRFRIPSSLNDEVENFAFVIDGAPQIHPSATDPADHFVKMPAWRRRRPAPLQPSSDQRSELDRPAADGLVADIHAPCREKLFNVAKAQAEAKVKPDGMADHVGRVAVAFEG